MGQGEAALNLSLHRTGPGQHSWRCKGSISRTLQPACQPPGLTAGRQVGKNTYEMPTDFIVHPTALKAGKALITLPGPTIRPDLVSSDPYSFIQYIFMEHISQLSGGDAYSGQNKPPLHPSLPRVDDDPGPETCVISSGSRDPAAVVQVRIVSWETILDYPHGPNVIPGEESQ